LGRKTIGINDNFFMLGGDSIKTIQIASRLNRFGYKIAINDIFRNPTISQLAPLIKKIERIPDQKTVTGTVPLTPIQQEFFKKIKIDPHHYNQAVMFYSKAGFEEEVVKTVFLKLQEHHDALRMTFREENGDILQVNRGLDIPLDLRVFDYRNRKDAVTALEKKANQIQASIDLETGPLMKLALFHLDDGDRLLIVIHHLVIDGVSWRILFEDIETSYRDYKKGKTLVLPRKTDSFKTWAEHLSQYANSQSFLNEKTYWLELESNVGEPIKKDFEVEDSTRKDTETLSFHLDKASTHLLLTRVNEAFNTEINDILLTAFGLGIKRTFGNDKVLIAMEGHGREEILAGIDIKRTVGWFTTVYPVLLDDSYENAGNNLSRQVKEIKECFRRVPHNGIGYGILKYLTAKKHKQGIDFRLQPRISFNYLGQFDADIKQMSFTMARESFGNTLSLNAGPGYELDISGMIIDDRLVISITYSSKQYKKTSIRALSDHYQEALTEIISYCSAREEKEYTPSDFTYPGLSIDMVDRLQQEYHIEDIYTLAPLQEGMLFHSLYEEYSPAYFLQSFYRLHGDLDISLVKRSFNELVKRHEVLRTLFVHKGVERPIQVVLREREIDFHYKDLRKISGSDEKEQLTRNYREEDRQRAFDFSRDNPTRITVLQLEQDMFELIWSHHHILMDGWCQGVLMTEYIEIYNSLQEKRAYQLPGITPYREYIRWLEKQPGEPAREYWRQYLEGYQETAVVPGLIAGKNEPRQYRIEEVVRTLGQEKYRDLVQLSARNQVTLNTVLHTLWGILLGKYNDKQDVVFGTVVSGRPSEIPGVESMVGLFINTLPVRVQYHNDITFKELLKNVQKSALDSEPYHYYPLAKIQSQTPLKKELFHHLVIYENYPLAQQIEGIADKVKQGKRPLKLELTNREIFEHTHYDFILVIGGEPITIKIQYNANVYDQESVSAVSNHFHALIRQVLEDETIKIMDIALDYDWLEAEIQAAGEEFSGFDF
jgi:iturin family lipopeptide synthetase B